DETVAKVQPLVLQHHNRLVIVTQDTLGSIRADAKKVAQILYNLLSNACKFTEGGTITITAQRDPSRSKHGGGISISVVDTGIGISAEQMPKLFQAFSQIDQSATRK